MEIKEVYTLIDEISDKHLNQLVRLIKTSVGFSLIVCMSFLFGSIPIKLMGYNFANIIFKSKLGILLPWLIVGVLYLLQSRSFFNMHMGLKPLEELNENKSDDENKENFRKKIEGYLSQKLRNHPSVFNPFSRDYMGLVLANIPFFLLSCLTNFHITFKYLVQFIVKIGKDYQNISFFDTLRVVGQVLTSLDLINMLVIFILTLPYLLFLLFMFFGIWTVIELEPADIETRLKREDISLKIFFLSAIISFFGAPIIGSILGLIIFFTLPFILS